MFSIKPSADSDRGEGGRIGKKYGVMASSGWEVLSDVDRATPTSLKTSNKL